MINQETIPTIHIDFKVPQSWSELDDNRLRYVYRLLSADLSADEVKTLCLLRWSGTKVVGRQSSGNYLLKKARARSKEERELKSSSPLTRNSYLYFEVTPLAIAEILPHLAWLDTIPNYPVRISKIKRQRALPADFSEVPFETFIICDNLYQGYLQTHDEALLDQLGATLYGKALDFKPCERVNIFYWFASLKDYFSARYPDFFQPVENATGNLLGATSQSVEASMNAQIRALTKGDITKETEVLALDTHRALTELNAQAREYREIKSKTP